MSIFNFFEKNLTSLGRNRKKKQVIEAIASSEQHNKGVINVHRVDKNNVGDYFCAPHLYYKELKGKFLDIYDYKSPDSNITNNFKDTIINNSLIIGGGGLLNRGSFELQMKLFEELSKKGKKTVIWGAGHNSKNPKEFGKVSTYNINPKNFGLVGVRDYNFGQEWVPCVSCMHPIFDEKFSEENEVGIIYHKKTIKNKGLLKKLSNYPSTSNTTNLEEMIGFIGSSQTVVTDSYHAMYWAMLLGKKVIVIPNSSKFFDFKYQPTFASFEDFDTRLTKVQTYSGILEECREINNKFAQKTFDYLNI